MFRLFISRDHLTPMSHKGLNVAYGNSFRNQWSFTVLETEVFKYNFVKKIYRKTMMCIF